AGVLIRPELPRAPHARLDLVEDQRDPRLVAELAQARQISVVGKIDAALPLDGLDENAGRPAVDGPLDRTEVVERHVLEAAGKRLEAVVVFLLGRGGDGG